MASSPPPPPPTILHRHFISASTDSGGGAPLPLTFFDVPWLFTGPVERIFFYALPPGSDFSDAVSRLLLSLESTIRLFYPLLGRVSLAGACYVYHDWDGSSVPVSVAESADSFSDLSGDAPRDLRRLYALIPSLPAAPNGAIPLSAFQLTVFPGEGIAVGVAIHHVACDDCGYMQFMKSWAAKCRRDSPPPKTPIFDRSLIADPADLANSTLHEMSGFALLPPPPPDSPPPKLLISTFLLSRDRIEKLKQGVVANPMAMTNGNASVHCSSFTVACAFVWACLLRVQGAAGDKTANLLFSVECRFRLSPPIPSEYFGNCLRPCFVECDSEELLDADNVNITTAALAIGKAIKRLEKGVLDGADGWFKKIMSLVPKQPMSVGGSPRYGVYETDFGWGRPTKVELVSIDKTPGTVWMSESRHEAGGIEIGVVLTEEDMTKFKSCFVQGLKAL